jgi:shikimate kinase
MKLSLVGYMGSGKTTLGKALAEDWRLPFIDLDQRIEAKAQQSIAQLISNKGELYFRQLEKEVLQAVLGQPSFILATGGGTPCYYQNMALLNQASLTAYLNVSVKQLQHRLKGQNQTRPLMAHVAKEDLREFIAKHLWERRPFYEQAQLTLPQDLNGTLEQMEYLKKQIS